MVRQEPARAQGPATLLVDGGCADLSTAVTVAARGTEPALREGKGPQLGASSWIWGPSTAITTKAPSRQMGVGGPCMASSGVGALSGHEVLSLVEGVLGGVEAAVGSPVSHMWAFLGAGCALVSVRVSGGAGGHTLGEGRGWGSSTPRACPEDPAPHARAPSLHPPAPFSPHPAPWAPATCTTRVHVPPRQRCARPSPPGCGKSPGHMGAQQP